jgi:hypothetical protein
MSDGLNKKAGNGYDFLVGFDGDDNIQDDADNDDHYIVMVATPVATNKWMGHL